MYERPESPYCPVKTFELYMSKLNPALSCLWQRPRATEHFSHSDEVWYCNVPLGKNTLGTFMRSIFKELKLSQKCSNHCIRETAVSLLGECNFEARHMCVFRDTNLRALFALTPGSRKHPQRNLPCSQ